MKRENQTKTELPEMIAIRTAEFAPILEKWERENRGVPWSELLRRALKSYPTFQKLAGKRHRHLVGDFAP